MAQRCLHRVYLSPIAAFAALSASFFVPGWIQPLRAASCVSEVPWFNRCTVPRVDSIKKNVLGLRDSATADPKDADIITGSIKPNPNMLTFPLPKERKPEPAVASPGAPVNPAPAKPENDRAPF